MFFFGSFFRHCKAEFHVRIDLADRFDNFVVVGRINGEDGVIFPEINGQFVGVRIEEQRGHVFDRKFILDKSETGIEILLVYGVFRFYEDTDNDGNTQKTNRDKQGGLQVFGKAVDAEFSDTVNANADTAKTKCYNTEREQIHRRGEFIGKSFDIFLVLHIFIITRGRKKCKPIACSFQGRKNNFFHENITLRQLQKIL